MRIAVFSARPYDERFLAAANARHGHELLFLESRLGPATAALAAGCAAVCAFVNDDLSAATLQELAARGVRLLALRSAGYNHVDLEAARGLGLAVVHVPDYSPHAVAEHTVALILALNRHIHRAYVRVREGNFALEGLLGWDLQGKTAGLVGGGQIGALTGRILRGFGCRVLVCDPRPSPLVAEAGLELASLDELLAASHLVSLHCPLLPGTRHLINATTLARMRSGAMLINTSRGGLVDTRAVIEALRSGQLGSLGIDVYEDEAGLFYEDRSHSPPADPVFAELVTLPNVLVTGHQGFFTAEALTKIAETTLENAAAFAAGQPMRHVLG